MNIEDNVKAAIEEFGDDAYKRFTDDNGLPFGNNSELIANDVGFYPAKPKPLSELFAHDIEVYGGNAYKMWETPYSEKDGNPNAKTMQFLKLNPEIGLERKASAELPFDIERAKAGDVVECRCLDVPAWENMGDTYYSHISGNNVILRYGACVLLSDLRMKYPPKNVQS